jgi:hypothetical protein
VTGTDLSLWLNDQPRSIESVTSLGKAFHEDRGRRLVIWAVTQGPHTEEISAFADLLYAGLLSSGDRLVLCSPLGARFFDRSESDPGEALATIRDQLSQDLTVFSALQEKIGQNLSRIREDFSGKKPGSPKWLKVLDRYEGEAKRLADHRLGAYLSPLSQAFEFIDNPDRTVWLLLFDAPSSGDASPFPARDGKPPPTNPGLTARLDTLARRLSPQGSPDLGDLADELLLRRIHLIGFHTAPAAASPGILEYLCRRSGLGVQAFSDARTGEAFLGGYRDGLWELVTPFDGRSEEKRIKLQSSLGELAHPARIRAEAFGPPGQLPPSPLTVDSVQVEGGDLVCRISGILMKDKQGGRLRLRVRVGDEARADRFDLEKELEVRDPVLSARIPLPDDIRGYLGLIIDALDLGNGKRVMKRVYLKR